MLSTGLCAGNMSVVKTKFPTQEAYLLGRNYVISKEIWVRDKNEEKWRNRVNERSVMNKEDDSLLERVVKESHL